MSRIGADKRLLIMFITSRLTCPLSGLGSDEPLPTGVACDAVCDGKISDYFPFNQTIFKTISKDEFKHDSYSFNCRHAANNSIMPDRKIIDELGG